MNLSARRRGLIGAKAEGPLLYSLYNYAFENEAINTGVKGLLGSGKSCTILLDFKLNTIPTGGAGRKLVLMGIWSSDLNGWGLMIGKKGIYDAIMTYTWQGVGPTDASEKYAGVRIRVAVLHEADSDTCTVKIKKHTSAVSTYTPSGTFVPAPNNTLIFGNSSEAGLLPTGTINKAEVYNMVLPTADINAFFAGT